MNVVRVSAALAGAVLLGVIAWAGASDAAETVDVTVPELSPLSQLGQFAFGQHCAHCHGENGAGSGKGPPLIHRIYEPNHHADAAFMRAIRFGTRAHHWPYGDMPPQEQVSDDEARAILQFVREVQRANGIE